MFVPAQLEPGRATIALVLVVLSVPALAVATYRYIYGDQSAEQFYVKTAMALFFVAILLNQLTYSFSRWAASGVRVLSYVAAIAFFASCVMWWRYRGTEK